MTRKLISALILFVAPLFLQSAHAFPDRPVKLIVSSPAGGPPDIMARLLSDRMAAALGQPVVVENRPGGAGGTIGAKTVLSAEPDGHTLMMGSTSSLLIAPLVYKNAGYTAETFLPVAGLSESTEVLAVHPSVKAGSVAELVALAKSQPGTLTYGSAGIGTLPHIEGELLKARARIDMRHIPYRGGGPALTGLLGGEIQIFFSALTQMLPYIRSGRCAGSPSPAAPAARSRRKSPPWWRAGSMGSSPPRSTSSSRRPARRSRSASRSAMRSRVRSPATISSRRSPRSAPPRGPPTRTSSPPTWCSSSSAGAASSRRPGSRSTDTARREGCDRCE